MENSTASSSQLSDQGYDLLTSSKEGESNISLTSAQAREKVTSAIATAMLDAFPFVENKTVVMDYACGSGSLSQRLAPFSKSILGVDINPDAVRQYNTKVTNQGIPPEEMRAICVDLQELEDVQVGHYDVIVCSQAYHHLPSIEETTCLLARFLKPCGMLLVSDLVKGIHANEFQRPKCSAYHDHRDVTHKGGLTDHQVRASFEKAGLVDIDFEIIATINRGGREIDIFMAQGVRPAEKISIDAT